MGAVIPIRQRIQRHIRREPATSCWIWTGQKDRTGYGRMRVDGRHLAAHRVAFEEYRGAIEEHLVLDHLCHQRPCVNPEHLEPVTHQENMRRAKAFGAWARPRRSLGESTIAKIRAELASGESRTSLSRKYNVAYTTIKKLEQDTRRPRRAQPRAAALAKAATPRGARANARRSRRRSKPGVAP